MSTNTNSTSIQSHFAVMCVMEDLIGSPDAESEASLLEARARSVPQLSALASTMGRDWCENEIVPYLMRVALEDEKVVSRNAAEQVAALCETRYFERSPEMQEALLLSVGVGFLTSTHAEVREEALSAVRKACAIIALKQIDRDSNNNASRHQVSTAACTNILRVVNRLLFETAFPTSLSSALCLLAPAVVDLRGYKSNPGFEVILSPLVLVSSLEQPQEEVSASALAMLTRFFDSNSVLAKLRLETAICGGTGRVTIVDTAIVRLLKEICEFVRGRQQQRTTTLQTPQLCLIASASNAAMLLADYIAQHIFTAPCPSAVFIDTALPMLCATLRSATSWSNSNSALRRQLLRLFGRIVTDWSACDDWAARFEIAKFAPQLFEALFEASTSQSSETTDDASAGVGELRLAVELLQGTLPRLVSDEEVEVSTAAAGSLPVLMAAADRISSSISRNSSNNTNSARNVALPSRLADIFSSDKLSAPSVQEAVATALGDAMREQENISITSDATRGQQQQQSQQQAAAHRTELSTTAHNTLTDLLATCEDDTVRAQIVESLLWSCAVPAAASASASTSSSKITPPLYTALQKSVTALLSAEATPNWRTRDHFASSLGKMVVHLLKLPNPQSAMVQHRGCFEFVVQPVVHMLVDRFHQIRSSALSEIVSAASASSATAGGGGVTRAKLQVLWQWITHELPDASRAPHYQTRIAFLVLAVVCATENDALRLLENAANDKIPNVRRTVAQALAQGCKLSSSASSAASAAANSTSNSNNGNADNRDKLPGRELIQGYGFAWSPANAGRVLNLLEKLVADESADVRESAAAGLAKCG